jgi:hypothetical protein
MIIIIIRNSSRVCLFEKLFSVRSNVYCLPLIYIMYCFPRPQDREGVGSYDFPCMHAHDAGWAKTIDKLLRQMRPFMPTSPLVRHNHNANTTARTLDLINLYTVPPFHPISIILRLILLINWIPLEHSSRKCRTSAIENLICVQILKVSLCV